MVNFEQTSQCDRDIRMSTHYKTFLPNALYVRNR